MVQLFSEFVAPTACYDYEGAARTRGWNMVREGTKTTDAKIDPFTPKKLASGRASRVTWRGGPVHYLPGDMHLLGPPDNELPPSPPPLPPPSPPAVPRALFTTRDQTMSISHPGPRGASSPTRRTTAPPMSTSHFGARRPATTVHHTRISSEDEFDDEFPADILDLVDTDEDEDDTADEISRPPAGMYCNNAGSDDKGKTKAQAKSPESPLNARKLSRALEHTLSASSLFPPPTPSTEGVLLPLGPATEAYLTQVGVQDDVRFIQFISNLLRRTLPDTWHNSLIIYVESRFPREESPRTWLRWLAIVDGTADAMQLDAARAHSRLEQNRRDRGGAGPSSRRI